MNDQIYFVQAHVIEELAAKGSCVIVGRCADYVLRDNPDLISIFIHADTEDKVMRVVNEYHGAALEEAESVINKADKRRANYYNYYTNRKWSRAATYDLCINSSTLGIDKTVELIKQYIELQ